MSETTTTIEAVRDVGPETVAIELRTPDGFGALPGQFVLVSATPDEERISRHYTLSSPNVDDTFEITVGVDPDGDLSPWLADCDGGEAVELDGPFGSITYEGMEDVVAVAGGPGVGPAVAIAEAAVEADHDAVVVYRDEKPAHRDRLESLDDGGATTVLTVQDDDPLADALARHYEDGRCYAFGFDSFVGDVADAIEAAGGDPETALIENFG